jgi:hypothetical protein
VAVYLGSSLSDLTPVASSDNAQSPNCLSVEEGQPGELAFNIDAGMVYRIAVDGYEGQSGRFDFEMVASTERLKPPSVASVLPVPETRIAHRHIRRRYGFASFWLASGEEGSSFQCKLDAAPFAPCGQVVRFRKLKSGRHQFLARTVDASGVIDPTPAAFSFKVRRPKSSR